MPLGRRKQDVRLVSFPAGTLPFLVRAPAVRVTANVGNECVLIAWRLALGSALPAADETIEQCGDGSTTGWRLELLTTGAVRFTTYRAGPASSSVTSSNTLTAADANKNFVVAASISGVSMSVYLNARQTTAVAGGAMVTPAGADLVLGAATSLGTDSIGQVRLGERWQTLPLTGVSGLDLATLAQRTRDAQRLEEPGGCVSYIDFGRYNPVPLAGSVNPGGTFGDDVTGAMVTVQTPSGSSIPTPRLLRADRQSDWSTA